MKTKDPVSREIYKKHNKKGITYFTVGKHRNIPKIPKSREFTFQRYRTLQHRHQIRPDDSGTSDLSSPCTHEQTSSHRVKRILLSFRR